MRLGLDGCGSCDECVVIGGWGIIREGNYGIGEMGWWSFGEWGKLKKN